MRSVLITGCSSGFGLHTAILLARRGWWVFASMRNLDKRAALDREAERAGLSPGALRVVRLDVTDPASVREGVEQVLEETGQALDAVIQNAGISVASTFEELPDEELRQVMETNFFGVLNVTRRVLPAMRARGRGKIVIMSSESAFFGTPLVSAYCASKWALEGWAESVALEVAPFGVRLVLVEPGAYRTSIWESSRLIAPEGSPYAGLVQRMLAKGKQPSHARDPAEVAEAVARLLESNHPRFRKPVGPDARVSSFAHKLLPYGPRTFLIRKLLGLPPPQSARC
jgi:NAD(P)-dependent dehydrogenase (short-subunit alcohol dehydrogenase family)